MCREMVEHAFLFLNSVIIGRVSERSVFRFQGEFTVKSS